MPRSVGGSVSRSYWWIARPEPIRFSGVDLTEYKGEARETARTFRATVLPTLVFLSPEGKEIGRIIGYTSVLFIEIQKILKGGEK